MATEDELDADVFDRTVAALWQVQGSMKGTLRTINAVRSRKAAKGTDREAGLLRVFAQDLRRTAVLLEDAAAEVQVVVHRR